MGSSLDIVFSLLTFVVFAIVLALQLADTRRLRPLLRGFGRMAGAFPETSTTAGKKRGGDCEPPPHRLKVYLELVLLELDAIVVARLAFAPTFVVTGFAMCAAVSITRLTLTRSGGAGFVIVTVAATLVITRFAMSAAVSITWLTLTRGGRAGFVVVTVAATFVVTRFAMFAAMVITWLTLTRGGEAGSVVVTVAATLVVTRFAMSAAMVITRLTLTRGGGAGSVVVTAVSLTLTTAVIAAVVDDTVFVLVMTNRIVCSASARQRAIADGLMDGPSIHASVAPAYPHAGGTPAVGFAGTAGEQR